MSKMGSFKFVNHTDDTLFEHCKASPLSDETWESMREDIERRYKDGLTRPQILLKLKATKYPRPT